MRLSTLLQTTLTLLCLPLLSAHLGATATPHSVNMVSGSNAAEFTADGFAGSSSAGVAHYVHWDNNYLYLGWSGGNTLYSSDLYFAAIDVNDAAGSSGNILGANFSSAAHDYFVVYENNSTFYGPSVTNGDALEFYQANGSSNWNFIYRQEGANLTDECYVFFGASGEVRVRIAWSSLGITPGANVPFAVSFWNNNNAGNYIWSSYPGNLNGPTPQTVTHKIYFPGTGSGVTPATAYTTVPLNTLLPVNLTSFSALPQSDQILLQWSTGGEINNAGFELQRSADARYWTALGWVPGQYNTTSARQYGYIDRSPLPGINYYRLRQEDADGSYAYSAVVSVIAASRKTYMSYVPATSTFQWTAVMPSGGLLLILDSNGRALYQYPLNGEVYEQAIDASSLASGIYWALLLDHTGRRIAENHFFVYAFR